ncbi:MAG: SsrA-binding protein SmpB [Rhodospirillales bacterium]
MKKTKAAREAAQRFVAQNRKARHNYFIDDTVEAGLVLTGTEVKSLRAGRASLNESFAQETAGEFFLLNAHIPEYGPANRFNHEPTRPRKLLLRHREIGRLMGQAKREGYTLVPLSLYFNHRGFAKCQLGLARGKRQVDKRETIKARDWNRERHRLLRAKD